MPLPKTKDIGKIMKVLNREGGRNREQKVAIALSVARKAGCKDCARGKSHYFKT